MKVALVHDYLREYGGAERVVEALHSIWPEAPLYTSFVDWARLGHHAVRFRSWDIRTSWVQENWLVKKFHSPLRFLAPKIWESFDLSEYDVVVTSSGWFMCRGVRAGRGLGRKYEYGLTRAALRTKFWQAEDTDPGKTPLQICYIHHPPRNLYGYATGSDIQKYVLVRAYSQVVNFFLRNYDFVTAQKVDWFVANSRETARRVWKFYRRESTVIYPPVEIKSQDPITKKQIRSKIQIPANKQYFLSVGRLSWAKRVDLAIEACNELKLPLKIAGSGKEEKRLRALAGPTIEFVGHPSDEELEELYSRARALVFTALDEDFGIVPVEAMGYGVPVIALSQGGVLETVDDGKTGVYFSSPTKESLIQAIRDFNGMNRDWSRACKARAKKFAPQIFRSRLRKFVESRYKEARTGA